MLKIWFWTFSKTQEIIKCTLNGVLNRPLHRPCCPQFVDRYAASVIMTMTYGKSTRTSYSDPEVIQVNRCLTRLGLTLLPGAWLVDSYPILKYVPGYLNQLKKWHEEELQLFRGQLDIVRRQIVSNFQMVNFRIHFVDLLFLERQHNKHPHRSRSTSLNINKSSNFLMMSWPTLLVLCLELVPTR